MMTWASYLEGGHRIELELPVGSSYPTQWGPRKVLACKLEPIAWYPQPTEPPGV